MISKIWDLVQQSLIRKHNLVGHLDNKPVAYHTFCK
jgi:hypothetical protein